MTLRSNKSQMRKLTPEDEDFCIILGHAYYPRAAISIRTGCPDDVQKIVALAITKGWITAEAWVKDSEYMWEKLSDNAS